MDKIDEWASRYRAALERSDKYSREAARYREKIRAWMNRQDRNEIRTPQWRIRRTLTRRTYMTKKETPPDIWDAHAIVRPIEMLSVAAIRPSKTDKSRVPA